MSKRLRLLVILAVAFMIIISTAIYLQLSTNRLEVVNVYVTTANDTIKQGEALPINMSIVISNASGGFNIDGSTYLKGLFVSYEGVNPSEISTTTPSPFHGIAKYNISSNEKHVNTEWNSTVLDSPGSYSLAPAGYYLIMEGSNVIHGPPNLVVYYHLPVNPIAVYGIYGNISTNSTGASISASTFGHTSNSTVKVTVGVKNSTGLLPRYSYYNFSGNAPLTENFKFINGTAQNSYETEISIVTKVGTIFYQENFGVQT